MKYKASIVIPSIRPEKWEALVQNLKESAGRHKIEIIFVGPEPKINYRMALDLEDVKFFRDQGSPSRCFAIGASLAEGEQIGLAVDDGIALGNALEQSIDSVDKSSIYTTILKYVEGGINLGFQNQAQHFHDSYWTAGFHADLRLPLVKAHWTWGLPLMSRDLYEELGGIDCRFEHINMNLHDLLFKVQEKYKVDIAIPNFFTFSTYFETNRPNTEPVLDAFFNHDNILFKQLYSDGGCGVDHKVDLDNWKQQPAIWERRFKKSS